MERKNRFASILSVIFCFYVQIVVTTSEYGYFWQITDIHYDSNYTVNESGVLKDCKNHSDNSFGDYNCDSPWKLAQSAVTAMKKIHGEANFILWTGDNVAHVDDTTINMQKAYIILKNVSDLLKSTFPKTKIFPTIGNHDSWPSDCVPATSKDPYFSSVLNTSGWQKFLDKSSLDTFKQGGYYAEDLGPFRIIALNTIIWYVNDPLVGNESDPTSQILWLDKQLVDARKSKIKVILSGHVPPGYFATKANVTWYYDTFNIEIHKILQDFSDVIVAAIFGHEHKDSFKVIYTVDNKSMVHPKVPVFLAPAVTPWHNSQYNTTSTGNNPSIRLYKYHLKSGEILDYTQYYLNLTAANKKKTAQWQEEYSFAESYRVQNVSAASIHEVIIDFYKPHSEKFVKYISYNSVGVKAVSACNWKCKVHHLCAMMYIESKYYYNCLKSLVKEDLDKAAAMFYDDMSDSLHSDEIDIEEDADESIKPIPLKPSRPIPLFMYIIFGLLALTVIGMLICISLTCKKGEVTVIYRKRVAYSYSPLQGTINA